MLRFNSVVDISLYQYRLKRFLIVLYYYIISNVAEDVQSIRYVGFYTLLIIGVFLHNVSLDIIGIRFFLGESETNSPVDWRASSDSQ